MAEEEQPLQEIKKIDDEVLDRFINTYGFKREIQQTKKGDKPYNIASASIGDNIFIIRRKEKNKYSFLSISKKNFDNFRISEEEGFTFKFIDFDTKYFKKNEQKFIKSLKENKMFDDIEVKDGDSKEFKDRTLPTFTKYNNSERIKKIDPMKIPDIQPEPVPEKKDEEELMGDDDEEEEEGRMIDEDEEEEKRLKEIEEKKRKMKKDEEEEKPDAFEDNQVFLEDEYDKEKEYSDDERELFKQAKQMKDRKLKKQVAEYNKKFHQEQKKQQKKQRSGLIDEKDNDVFDQLTTELKFNRVGENTAKSFLRVGDDVIFIRKPQKKKPGTSKLGENNYLAVKLNKEDFRKMYTNQEDDIKAEYFNFSPDYFDKNKDKIIEAIKKGKFAFDDEIKKNKEESGLPEKFSFEDLKTYDVIPGKRNFNYVKMFDLKRGNIKKEKGDDGQQLITFSKDGKNVTVNLPNKYLSNGYPDSLLKLIVGVSENNKGEVDFKEIGEIQDLNGDITNLYSDMQDLKSKINSSNNEEEKERLLIKYNKKRLKLEDLIKKYSKEAYRLSTLKKKKATMATHKYLMNKLNKLKT